ncbi:TPA: hydroxyacid dehydrogenase [Candidatus Woesearchaeota archaeon]|nr:hydroxyacid dehydrogenase [Candidatus Woesearchaeota archaeon]HIH32599.1 hydroxyacid dehydrogenase [Candidatus Woesearchaeota archaeon]HIH54934.1 hydroxyacid dehydrogenase [Candidatus Woesearchaeota archaeon]HIJ01776.1 hydroxyacid dehydrogenase [Candidatus Woesearchaeota archaeon]HIJ14018.1 hydroxyacid dehydrogenase [Candidatus Woesearchaeota archaeon]
MKIAFFDIEDWEVEHIKKNIKGHELKFFKESISKNNISLIKNYDAIASFIYAKLDKKILDRLPKLKLIATMSTGYDHIDLKECNKRKIMVCNVPYYGENTVAEHTFALILALSRKIYPSIQRTKMGLFDVNGLRGFDLKDKTIGLIGTGHISFHVARIAKGFEMKIIGYDIFKNKDMIKLGLKYVSLNELLKKSDIISLHLPLNKSTFHIINSKNIKTLKNNSIIINTARGGLIETSALGKSLASGKLLGAGLDVLEEEGCIKHEDELLRKKFRKPCNIKTLLENHVLMKLDNVIITPHNAFNSQEALQRIIDVTIENIKAFHNGKTFNAVKQ